MSRFFKRLQFMLTSASSRLLVQALKLYYVSRKPNIPKWAKFRIYAALFYFIFPLDLIPDFIPLVGYTDDLFVLGLAVAALAFYIDDDVLKKAEKKLQSWLPST